MQEMVCLKNLFQTTVYVRRPGFVACGKDLVAKLYKEVMRMPPKERGIFVKEMDGDVTKKVDKVANEVVHEGLEKASRKYGVRFSLVSEEDDQLVDIGSGSRKVYCILDPIDGSWNAATNVPFYSSNIAFTRATENDDVNIGDFHFGIVGVFEKGDVYFASKGRRAIIETGGKTHTLFTSSLRDPGKTRTILDSYTASDRKLCEDKFRPLRLGFRDCGRFYGAGAEAMHMVAPEGMEPGYVAYVSMDQKSDNIVAPKIIIQSAGGIASDWDGNPLDKYGLHDRPNIVFSSNRDIHDYIILSLKR